MSFPRSELLSIDYSYSVLDDNVLNMIERLWSYVGTVAYNNKPVLVLVELCVVLHAQVHHARGLIDHAVSPLATRHTWSVLVSIDDVLTWEC